jgi:hypothetical protein
MAGKEADADEGAGQVEEPLEQVGAPLVADAEAKVTDQPGEGALDHPPVLPQPLGGVDAASSNARGDAAGA